MCGVMQAAGLTDKLGDARVPYTVLAPTDEAFGIIPQEDFDALVDNTAALNVVRALLLMHVACSRSARQTKDQ